MRYLYTALMYLCVPYFLLRLLWKSRRLPAYRNRIAERFSCPTTCSRGAGDRSVDIWIHAVSLGEVIAATSLIEEWLKSGHHVLITTMTPTGSERVSKQFGNRALHQYLPYDLPYALRRFLKQYSPKIAVIMETELWPNLIYTVSERRIPLVLVNGRLSKRSCEHYHHVKFWFRSLLKLFSAICVQTEADKAHFIALGANPSTVEVLGNVKFDMRPPGKISETWMQLKRQWGSDRPVIILASTHEDEEKQFLSQLTKLHQSLPDVLLLIVPRHPERFNEVYQLSVNMGFKTGRRSQIQEIFPTQTVIIVDAMGELMQAYQSSDYAFVGGSLVPVGGHNVLEPILAKIPVFSGPHVHNFTLICDLLVEKKAIGLLPSAAAVFEAMVHLSYDPASKQRQIDAASQVLVMNQGALTRYTQKVESYL